jgi:4-hydroxy-3-methylbut-2-enyl diphosphate reductase
MKINIARSAGFCFGVKNALDIAFKTAKTEKNVYMLGDIVHNEDVIDLIERSGIKKVSGLDEGYAKTLLIRAHGTAAAIIEHAEKLGYKIIDATCPMVKEIHNIAKNMEKNGSRVIIIGEKNHDEVRGIIGQLSTSPIIIGTLDQITPALFNGIQKAGVVVQSTQNYETVIEMEKRIKAIFPGVKFNNTICEPTKIKQKEAKTLPVQNDVIIVIGSRTSANTKRLYQISKNLNPRTYWINSKEEIDPKWFAGAEKTGITAGASTPKETIEDIVSFLESLNIK